MSFFYLIVQRGRGGCSQGFGVLSGFWSCSQGFGVKIGNLSEKSIKKGTFKPKIKKRALLPLFYGLCSGICGEKNRKFYSQ